ncbi:MAG: DMT family transporter [Pseudomonadota bacterium]
MSDATPMRGILLIVFGLAAAALSGAQMKMLSEMLPVLLIVWARFAGYFLIILPVVLARRTTAIWPPVRPGLQVLRGLCMCSATICFVMGARTLNFADAIAILYAYPFMLTLAAPIFLGEQVRRAVWIGVAAGFVGVLIVMRPGFDGIGVDALWVLGAAVSVTTMLIINRKLGAVTDPLVTSSYGAFIAMVLTAPGMVMHWQPIGLETLGMLVVLGFTGAISQTTIVLAFSRAPASDLAVFTYSEIVSAVVIGFLLFGTWPDGWSWVGIGLIVISGAGVARAMQGPSTPRRAPKI